MALRMRGDAVGIQRPATGSGRSLVSRTLRSAALDPVLPQLVDELLDAVDTAVIVTNLEGVVELWNDAAERLYGWSAVEAIGEPLAELIVPESQQGAGHEIFGSLLHGDGWSGTFLCRRRDGSRVPVRVTDVPIPDSDGTVRALIGLSRNVTDELVADRDCRTIVAMTRASRDAVLTASDGRVVTWSAGAQRLLGWSEDEIVGALVAAIVPEEWRAAAIDLQIRVESGETVVGFETDCLARDGARIPVTVDVTPVYDGAAQRWVAVVTARDRRTRDEVIEAAIAAESRSRILLSQASETVFVLDADYTLRSASAAVERVLGYAPEDLIGTDASRFMHPDDLPRVREAFDHAVSVSGGRAQVTYRRRTAAGDWAWAEATITNQLDDPVVAGVVANVRDVDEREQALASVVEREARLSAVMSRSSDVAIFFDRDGTIRWVSPAITAALGLAPDNLLGTNAIDLVHPEDRGVALRTFGRWLEAPSEHVRVEFRFLDPAGRVRWVEQVATDLTDDPSVGCIVANLRDVTDRRLAHDELARLALVDTLTGLPNRNALQELAIAALDRLPEDRCCAIAFFDLDDFGDVNDALGHAAGDELLVGIARRVEAAIPENATLTRFGGDQFAVLCDGVADLPETLAITAAVQQALAAPFVIDQKEVFAVVSFGLALSPPDDIDVLLRRADVALRRAKSAGRGQTVVFEREQGTESVHRLHYAGEVRRAIARGEIVAHYQPVVDLATGRAVGVEALARWDHPDRGRIAPDLFIPVAESTGLIGELGDRILEQACADAVRWLERGRRLQLAVNASAVQLMDPAFPDRVAATLRNQGMSPQQLAIEVTETAALRDLGLASQTLDALRCQGIELSLDDFGTGYSSLSLLKRLPVGALKVDRSFVSGLGQSPEDDQIVTGVIGLALALGFIVVAEGVETVEQADALRRLGCHYGQGYLWAPAVPADDLLATIASFEG